MQIAHRLTQQDTIRPLTPHEVTMATRILELNLGYSPLDTVLIVTDEQMLNQEAAIWFETAKALGLPVELVVISGMTHSGEEPPPEIIAAAEQASINFFQTTYSLTHTQAGKKSVLNNGRGVSLPGADYNLLIKTLSADYGPIQHLGEQLKTALSQTETLTITSAAGTNLTTKVRTTGIINDSGFFGPGEMGNLPAGEVFFAPLLGTTSGTLVIDGSIADDILDAPITVVIENGVATSITGGTAATNLLQKLNAFGPAGLTVAEVGIGTNEAAEISDNLLEAEKAYGTVHIAFGNSSAIGGENDVAIHIDGLVSEPVVSTDAAEILRNRTFTL